MPGAQTRVRPGSANEPSASDEASKLELCLQRQLEEDIARIFDESIYSDIELVCGKLKILTHSCILKARTKNFYRKLDAILQLNIGRNTYDEIYSFISDVELEKPKELSYLAHAFFYCAKHLHAFIWGLHFFSDAYTECNIKLQEQEIIAYLEDKLKSFDNCSKIKKEDIEELEVFLTPKCISPNTEHNFSKTISSSPSTELTKEYYALVPIDNSLLDKELIEQDVLSNAFHSIIKTQSEDLNNLKSLHLSKPTTLFLSSSHIPKTIKHSNSCDILTKCHPKDSICSEINAKGNNTNVTASQNLDSEEIPEPSVSISINLNCVANKILDPTFSPDSLITDDPSSSSDYQSAAFTCSPGVVSAICYPQFNVGDSVSKMENIFPSSDSGLENTGMLESLSSHKDVTLTDVSLTESTLHEFNDDVNNVQDPMCSSSTETKCQNIIKVSTPQTNSVCGIFSDKDVKRLNSQQSTKLKEMINCRSSKEEKQRQNEEIVILESSSLSSETGSWESVFPQNFNAKEICDKFIFSEKQFYKNDKYKGKSNRTDKNYPDIASKYPLKSTSCFIDAASLVDEEDDTRQTQSKTGETITNRIFCFLPHPSQPVPCSSAKLDISPNDWSESNDDSLEQVENKDQDSIQKDLSPTIFDMTPITEDSLSTNLFEKAVKTEQEHQKRDQEQCHFKSEGTLSSSNILMPNLLNKSTAMITSTPTKLKESDVRSVTPIKIEQDGFLQKNILEENAYHNTVYSEGDNGQNIEFRRKSDSPSSSSVIMSVTPHNSIMSLKSLTAKHIDSDETESDTGMIKDNYYVRKQKKYNESSPIISGGASVEDHLPQLGSNSGSPLVRRRSENKPIVSGAYIPQIDKENKKLPKLSTAPVWIVDMSEISKSDIERNTSNSTVKKPENSTCENLKVDSKHLNNVDNFNKSRSSVDSDSSEKSSHKFYIDLSSLPDPIPMPPKKDIENSNEKKNIFSMYFDLGDKTTVKEMPVRLASSFNTKKTSNTDTKSSPKPKSNKNSSEYSPVPAALKSNDLICSTSTFEQYESLCNDPNLSISDIIRLPEKLPDNMVVDREKLSTNSYKKGKQLRGVDDDRLLFNTSSSIQEETANEQTGDLFVKLSDLDKPATLTDNSLYVYNEKVTDVRMTRSIPDNNWREHSHNSTSTIVSNKVISSFHSENALSLNRLFPHLKNEFSRSMPGSLSSRTRSPLRLGASSSPGEMDGQPSDVSEVSSMQSSMCRSVIENSTTEETSQTSSLIGNCQSRLGQDLLRMFLEEIAPDVIVEVSGRRIKAHKCILSSRCQYFAGILSGGWVESAGNVIILPPFSFNVVHFALCHIYSGVSTIPDSVSIVELATIADMLGLEGLKEAIMFTLKVKYCHHFHRPCPVCTAGVLECFPLSSVYGLDDLYHKCLKWITKYFSKVWPTKAFATLPKELLDKCYQQHIVHLTTDNFVDTVYGCGIAVASLQNSRWSESVARMCRRLVNAAAQFAAPRLMGVLGALAAVPPEASNSAAHALQDCIAAAIDWAPPDETCRAYAFLSNIVKEIKHHNSKPDLITNGAQNKVPGQNNLLYSQATSWRLQCEGALVRAAPRAVSTQAFKELPTDLRKRLRELGCIIYGTQTISVTSFPVQEKKSRSSHSRSRVHQDSRTLGIDHVRASFVPYAPKPSVTVSTSDIIKSKNDIHDCKKMSKTCPPKVRTTKAQEERAKFNLSKTNQSQEGVHNKVSASRLHSFDNAKPRYLEPKCKEVEKKTGPKMLAPKMISSSESSRNSSPNQACKLRANRMKGRGCEAMSQDSLATSSRPRTAEPSTDSLSESQISNNKYATYTKIKHTTKGSVESIASSKYQNNYGASLYRTKIPIKLNQGLKPNNNALKHNSDQKRPVSLPNQSRPSALTISSRNRTTSERKLAGSLMNATKSSSAKMVPKVVKESQKSIKQSIKGKQSRQVERDHPPEIPIMERSGTFLKDEPTFGDKTTNIDIQ